MKKLFIVFLTILCALPLLAKEPIITPEIQHAIDSIMQEGIAQNYPGAVICIVSDTGIVYLEAFGNMRVYPDTVPMRTDAIFDLASLSKVTATCFAIHHLASEGLIDLNAPVDKYLFGFSHHIRSITPIPHENEQEAPIVYEKPITVMHLLTHTSGMPSYASPDMLQTVYGGLSPELVRDYIYHCPRKHEAGTDYIYSCLNFITLQYIVEAVTNQPFNQYVEQHVFTPLGMTETGYRPDTIQYANRIAPTEVLKDGHVLFGEVHDPLARLGNLGISGNAGVFSTAQDLAKMVQFLICNQDNPAIQTMTSIPDSLQFTRTAGWQGKDKEEPISYLGNYSSNRTYGHTGYTGTSIGIDPERKIGVIILTNRVHPTDNGKMVPTRMGITDLFLHD